VNDVVSCSAEHPGAATVGSCCGCLAVRRVDDVVTLSAVDDVEACAAKDRVVALASTDDVVAAESTYDVVTFARDDDVGPGRALQHLAIRGADDGR